MAIKKGRRKKYPKLPNGFGSIKYLGKGRRNPYAVHPPTTEFTEDGKPKTPKAICYVDDYMKGFAVLVAYKANTYYPGMEKDISFDSTDNQDEMMNRILADYNRTKGIGIQDTKPTFEEVYKQFYDYKFVRDKSRVYSKSTISTTEFAFKKSSALHKKIFESIKHKELQDVVDGIEHKRASKEHIVSLFHQMYKYALSYEIVEIDRSANLKVNTPEDDEHGVPFTDDELKILWTNKNNDIAQMLLIMCYSGFRVSAYSKLEVNIEEMYFKGGIKTAAGKNRIVPIHSGIQDMVKERTEKHDNFIGYAYETFRKEMLKTLKQLGIEKHTPHDCRHTFSKLCDDFYVNEREKMRMMGHSFKDVTNKVYGHENLERARKEIEKIKICY